MRILFTRFPLESIKNGGAEKQIVSLLEGLKSRGHEVSFLGSCPVLIEECRARGIPVQELTIGPPPVTKWGVVSVWWRKRVMGRKLKEVLEFWMNEKAASGQRLADSNQQNYPLPATRSSLSIVMLSLTEKLLLTDFAVARGAKVLWVEHDPLGRWLTWNPWKRLLLRQSQFARTITVSELMRRAYMKIGWDEDRVIAIADGVEEKRLAVSEKRIASDNQQAVSSYPLPDIRSSLLLGCIARLVPQKGVDVLLHAVAALPRVSLTIVGSGEQELHLRGLIQTLHLTDRVTIIPKVDDVRAFYRRLDVLVLPSRALDPFGMAPAEAMMEGTAVIVTDATGISGYLEDGVDTFIVKAGDAASLTRAIAKMEDVDVRRSLAIHGQATARMKFDVTAMVTAYEEEMRNGVRNPTPSASGGLRGTS